MKPRHPTAILVHPRTGARGVITAHSVRHDRTLVAIRRVHAASLRALANPSRDGAYEQQETPDLAGSEVSTAHPICDMEVRAARAQSDTNH